MPWITLKFRMPEEQQDLDMALQAAKYKYALDDMSEYLRGKIKYTMLTDNERLLLEDARAHLLEALD